MKIMLVFNEWIDPRNKELSPTQEHAIYNSLTLSDLHSGTIFNGAIVLGDYEQRLIAEAAVFGLRPSFYILEGKLVKD